MPSVLVDVKYLLEKKKGRAAIPKTGLKKIHQLSEPLPIHTWSNRQLCLQVQNEQGKG